ncbi:MAG: hypothetical protein C0524_01105 [Rhodobacter sp.]|nr:hypothetical protein [Rhodobacter sp.]
MLLHPAEAWPFRPRMSARLERSLSDNGRLVFEVGYEVLPVVGNGIDRFPDVDTTATTAEIDSDSAGAGYVSVGYAFRF